jgi:hypothetical protein
MREGKEPKAPRHASAAAARDNRLPHSRYWQLFFYSCYLYIYRYRLTCITSLDYPIIPYARLPIRPSYKTVLYYNLPQPAAIYYILPRYRILLNSAEL